MLIEEALYSLLKTDSGLFSYVETKIYPEILPEGVSLPAITYRQVSGNRYHSLNGDTGLTDPIFQISAFATTRSQARLIAEAVRSALQNHSGLMGGESGVNVQAVLLENELSGFDEGAKEFYVYQDYRFFFNESV